MWSAQQPSIKGVGPSVVGAADHAPEITLGIGTQASPTVAAYVIEAFSMYYIAQHLYPLRYDLPRIVAASAAFLIVLAATQASWTEKHRMLAMSLAAVFSFGLLAGLGLKHASSLLSSRRDVT